jgi:[ribosomal protein S18]-alanine N-acetyltransferase
MDITIRNVEIDDFSFLKKMLYDALFVPEGSQPFPELIIELPEISKYIDNWGRDGDIGLLAENNGKPVGVIWARLFPEDKKGYGFIDKYTPETSMAVDRKFRNQGIGTKLLASLFDKAKVNGYKTLSLSVDKRNKVLNLYKRLGFEIVGEVDTAYTMKKVL